MSEILISIREKVSMMYKADTSRRELLFKDGKVSQRRNS